MFYALNTSNEYSIKDTANSHAKDYNKPKFKENDYVIYIGKELDIYGEIFNIKHVFDELDVIKYRICNNSREYLVDECDIITVNEYENIKNIINIETVPIKGDISQVSENMNNVIDIISYTDYRIEEIKQKIKKNKKLAKLALLARII